MRRFRETLPADILLGEPRVLLRGDGYLLVENHRGVSAYAPDCLRLRTRDGCLLVEGCGLILAELGAQDALITGTIRRVTLEGRAHA